MVEIKDKEFLKMVEYVKDNFGINLIHKRTLIESRLGNMLVQRGFKNYSDYFDFVISDKSGVEVTEMLNRLTTNLTYFMREEKHFEFFKTSVLPYIESKVHDRDLRVWSAGCSTGEEPYTLEMILADYFKDGKSGWDTKVLATDISKRVLDIAKKGVYKGESIQNIPTSWKINYFNRLDGNNYEVSQKIKKELVFAQFNLMDSTFPFRKKFHVIFCRNVMIYFDTKTKNELVQKFYDYIEDGGYLFIGHSESIDRNYSNFKYVIPAVYRKI